MSTSVAIVTGASQGIGRATALRLARDFSSIVLVARDRANLEATAAQVETIGAEPLVVDVDLAEPSAPPHVVERTLSAFGRIDALLNIAGAVPQIDLFEMTDAQWEGGLALKLHGARRLTIAAWPALKEAKGSVVLMSGNSAIFPKAPYAAVGTINAAIVALAKAFADRGLTDGVQVNSVQPGPVMTGRRRSYLERWAPLHHMSVEEATAHFPSEAGIARYGEPEEIAELMAFLVSPGARWMTGSTLRMDGGEVKSIERGQVGAQAGAEPPQPVNAATARSNELSSSACTWRFHALSSSGCAPRYAVHHSSEPPVTRGRGLPGLLHQVMDDLRLSLHLGAEGRVPVHELVDEVREVVPGGQPRSAGPGYQSPKKLLRKP